MASWACAWLLATGCGFDLAGARELADAASLDESPPRPEGGHDPAPSPDAALDGDFVADAEADTSPPLKGPCDDPSIVFCAPFDGTAVDVKRGKAIGGAITVTFVPGVVGQAALLGATSALVVLDNAAWAYTTLTVEMWARPDELPAAGARAGLLDKDGSFGVFAYPDGTVSCIMNQTATATVFVTLGTWVHVACVNDGISVTLYANGVLAATTPSAGVVLTSALTAIGNNSPDLGSPLLGAIDMLRVYSRAKTAAEIAADATP